MINYYSDYYYYYYLQAFSIPPFSESVSSCGLKLMTEIYAESDCLKVHSSTFHTPNYHSLELFVYFFVYNYKEPRASIARELLESGSENTQKSD